jgi:UDPglucose 6-dehydrogenase
MHPERIVVGVADQSARGVLEPILSKFCSSILWTDVNSAEMVKHALNAWLATSITLTNELASICERVGGDFADVEKALRLDPRIGARAYVRPGGAFGGGTLARDVRFLEQLAATSEVDVFVLNSIRKSNSYHAAWVLRQLEKRLGSLSGRRIGLLGLAYKAGTDAIRRSVAVELARSIASRGGRVTAFDPKVSTLPAELATDIHVAERPACVFRDADAIVVATEWPEFRLLPFEVLIATMGNRLAIDQNGHLRENLEGLPVRLDYVALGRAQ